MMTRRKAMGLLVSVPLAAWATESKSQRPAVSLGFSLYGMKGVPLADAVRTCAKIGYDGVEVCLIPGWWDAGALSTQRRGEVRSALQSTGLVLLALMEQIYVLDRDMPKQTGLDRIRKAAEIGHALSIEKPKIETVLGGKPADWESSKHAMVERLGLWANEAQSNQAILCIKAHVGGAVDTPDKLLWLYRQVNRPALKLTYDYSHFQLMGLPLERTLRAVVPYSAFIHVKDAEGDAEHPRFLLAGDGTVDYAAYFRLLKAAGYSGPVVAEVSAQLQHLASYNPFQAAQRCYACLSQALESAHLARTRTAA
jgi:sugar phosphate isomerase/epimerase